MKQFFSLSNRRRFHVLSWWSLVMCFLLGFESFASAATYYVRTDGNDSNVGTGPSAAQAWATVAAAATKTLAAGDIVYVQTGTYVGSVQPSVDGTSGNPIRFIADTVGSIFGTPGDVILQATSGNLCLDMHNDDYLQFECFHFQGDGSSSDAIELRKGDGIRLERCEVYGAGNHGILVSHNLANLTLINCLIRNNASDGIRLSSGNLTVWNTTISGSGSDGIEQDGGTSTITNSIIANSTDDGLDRDSGTMTHTYNLVWNNGDNDFEGTSASTGELSADPVFVSSTDYHLRSTSPAVNSGVSAAGTVDDDFHGNPRPTGGNWDMGYHEYDSTSGTTSLLLVTRNNGYLTTQERYRKTLFEAWNYAVTSIWAGDSQANFDTALANADVVYISEEVLASDVGYKLRETAVSVVNEVPCLADEFGLASSCSTTYNTDTMSVTDNTHYITSIFSLGNLQLFATAQDANYLSGTIAPSASILGDFGGNSTLAAVDVGDTLATTYNSSNLAFGRRVQLPWGSSGFDFSSLTIDGQTLVQRALQWAAGLTDLVGHWLLDEVAGTTATDSSPSGLDGTYTNGVTLNASGPYPGAGAIAAEFDGSDDLVDLPDLNTNYSQGFAAAFWFNPASVPSVRYGMLGITNGQDVDDIWIGWIPGTGLELYFSDTTDSSSSRWLDDNVEPKVDRWQHYVASVDSSGNAKIYRDGVEVASGFVSLPGNVTRTENFIGRSVWNDEFEGKMFDVRVYNRSLSATEVADVYGLVGHWKFDEGSGGTTADSSGYANDATLNGATWTSDCTGKYALEFDGTGDTTVTGANFDPPETGAVALWMRSAGNPAARSRPFGLGGNWEMRQESDGTLSFDLGGEGPPEFVTTDGLSNDSQWFHVVAQFNATDDTFEVYLNGELHTSGTNTTDMVQQTADLLTFGTRTGNSEYWAGALRDFRVYNRYLSNEEIGELSGLVARWNLDETSGTVAADAGVLSNDANYVDSPTLGVTGAFAPATGTAVELNGSSEFIAAGKSLMNDLTEFSLMGWLRPDSTIPDKSFFGQNGLIELGVDFQANQLDLWTANGGSINAPIQLPAGKWTHVAATGDGTALRLYVDGIEVTSGGSATASYGSNTEIFKIGEGVLDPTGDHFDGRLDDVRVYSRAICPEEINAIYKGGRPTGIRIRQWTEIR